MPKIRVLPEHLVNQIAAGEVVERPASVVKELCENALDAGSRTIRVEMNDGGLRRILVADDGCGMSRDDARTCLERHATSKLADAEGLKRIATMGFRGEAVPAIASVSRFTLVTREKDADVATRILVEGGKIEGIEDAGAPQGTSVLVEDLFFNTPARRKFLKRPETEMGHASEALVRLALGRPDVAFSLVANGRATFTAPAAEKDARERVAAALGSEVFKHLIPVTGRGGPIGVTGHIASPDYTLSSARGLYTFVNRRFVRDRGLIAAVQRAFADVTFPGRQPAAVLFLDVPPDEVDVNVHPQKLEVRFSDGRLIFDTVFRAVQDSLRRSPWLARKEPATPASEDAARERVGEALSRYSASPPDPSMTAPFAFHAPAGSAAFGPTRRAQDPASQPQDGAEPSPSNPSDAAAADGAPPKGYFGSLRVIGQFARTYLVCEAPSDTLVLIDQHAAHERVKFDELRRGLRERKSQGQAFLFPTTVALPLAEARAIADHLDEVRALGFEAEPFGGTSFALKSVPAPLVGCDYRKLLCDLGAELLSVERGRAFDDAMNDVLATMACHAAVRAHQTLSREECRALLDALDGIDFNTRCPHGRPVLSELSLYELERKVGRR